MRNPGQYGPGFHLLSDHLRLRHHRSATAADPDRRCPPRPRDFFLPAGVMRKPRDCRGGPTNWASAGRVEKCFELVALDGFSAPQRGNGFQLGKMRGHHLTCRWCAVSTAGNLAIDLESDLVTVIALSLISRPRKTVVFLPTPRPEFSLIPNSFTIRRASMVVVRYRWPRRSIAHRRPSTPRRARP